MTYFSAFKFKMIYNFVSYARQRSKLDWTVNGPINSCASQYHKLV